MATIWISPFIESLVLSVKLVIKVWVSLQTFIYLIHLVLVCMWAFTYHSEHREAKKTSFELLLSLHVVGSKDGICVSGPHTATSTYWAIPRWLKCSFLKVSIKRSGILMKILGGKVILVMFSVRQYSIISTVL